MQPLKHLSNKAAHINGKLCRQFVSLVNLNQSRHESKCRDSNEQATSEQATGKQARQPVFGQAVNRLFAQQATEELTTGEHEKDKW